MTAPVTATRSDGMLIIRLVNAAARNAIGLPFAQALFECVGGELADVGAVVIVPDGDHFSVGGDVWAMAAAEDRPAFVRQLADSLHGSMRALRAGPPVVVGTRGWAAGAGMSLVLAADVVVAGESATFQPAYAGIGVTPDGGMSWNLPRIVGERVARSLILRNVVVHAEEAQRLGLADMVVPNADVEGVAVEIARGLANGPREAHLGAKRLLHTSGVAAFVERRAPTFRAG